jgi:hypothetical protein
MIESILGKDGITPEMIKGQQERIQLIERLLQVTSRDVRSELIKQNTGVIDDQFFALFSRIAQNAVSSRQEPMARTLVDVQKQLLEETEFGRTLQESVKELEAAQKALQGAGQNLTREKLLELVLATQSDAGLRAYVSLARAGMDYVFFQTLTEKIDRSTGEERNRLEATRGKLLEFINEVDRQLEARYKGAQELVESILAREDVEKATQEKLESFSQDAVEVVNQLLRGASEKNDYTRMGKLQKMVQVLQEASAPPPEVALIEQLIQLPDAAAMEKMLAENDALVTGQFMEALSGLVAQMDAQGSAENPEARAVGEKLDQLYKVALKRSMRKNVG